MSSASVNESWRDSTSEPPLRPRHCGGGHLPHPRWWRLAGSPSRPSVSTTTSTSSGMWRASGSVANASSTTTSFPSDTTVGPAHTPACQPCWRAQLGGPWIRIDFFLCSCSGPEDLHCRFGRGGPEPFYACTLDTYGPSISSIVGQIRDGRSAEVGEYIGERTAPHRLAQRPRGHTGPRRLWHGAFVCPGPAVASHLVSIPVAPVCLARQSLHALLDLGPFHGRFQTWWSRAAHGQTEERHLRTALSVLLQCARTVTLALIPLLIQGTSSGSGMTSTQARPSPRSSNGPTVATR